MTSEKTGRAASAEIITIGTELLLGQLVDTNTATIAAGLAEIGIDVYRETSIGDNQERIAQAIRDALARSDAVICAGGLGPTVDDLTREAVSAASGKPLRVFEPVLDDLREFFAGLGRKMSANNERQATFPEGAIVLDNPNGTAPGFAVEIGDKIIIALPGPPREMEPMLRNHALPLLAKKTGSPAVIATRVLRTIGLAESEVDARIDDYFRSGVNPSIAVLAHLGQVDVKLTAKAKTKDQATALIRELEPKIRERLEGHVFSSDGSSLAEELGKRLRARNWTMATAESCTGGLVGALITSVAGASDYYCGGVVAYSNEAKTRLLGVSPELIERHGAVSEEVAVAMAAGAKEALNATIGLSVTGIAGPGGGTEDKPVGLVYLALARDDHEVETKRMRIAGNREAVQHRASLAALTLVWRAAEEKAAAHK